MLIEPRNLGFILLLIGLGLLLTSFGLAYVAYASAELTVSLGGDIVEAFTALIQVIAMLLPRLIWIAIMVFIGSIVLSKGISLLSSKPSEEAG
ncbi:MAG: hypothetical protein NDF55_07870 [archaeon GB-1867-005]|nr:hypothetical protein [Candidatus Culexmicrobium cathedralense]